MKSSVCIFEDVHYKRLFPLVYFRPVYDLRCGVFTLRQKIENILKGHRIYFHARNVLTGYLRELYPDDNINAIPETDTWFINGRLLADATVAKLVRTQSPEERLFRIDGEIAAAFIHGNNVRRFAESLLNLTSSEMNFENLPSENFSGTLVRYPWEIIHKTAEQMEYDFQILRRQTKASVTAISKHAHLLNKKNMLIGKHSTIKPGAVIDAEKGPIIIGKNVTIMPHAFIEGPAFIGDHSIVKVGAKIYHGTSIGEWCKVGGEVEASIIHSYSNKQHDGFLGHSYLGSWINIGADTNNSDLKNTYGTIKVHFNGEEIDTGSQFVGLMMGDHSKTGINVMFDTGTIVGVSCNIYGAGLPPKYIPSFSWGEGKSFSVYRLEQGLETARRMMARRNVQMSAEYEELYRSIFYATENERQNAGIQ
ncbi:MAG: GlmU family protein [Ignavibacteriae bacterium]|nr:GlmU family protein [Ignavibacteriota bacterium]